MCDGECVYDLCNFLSPKGLCSCKHTNAVTHIGTHIRLPTVCGQSPRFIQINKVVPITMLIIMDIQWHQSVRRLSLSHTLTCTHMHNTNTVTKTMTMTDEFLPWKEEKMVLCQKFAEFSSPPQTCLIPTSHHIKYQDSFNHHELLSKVKYAPQKNPLHNFTNFNYISRLRYAF